MMRCALALIAAATVWMTAAARAQTYDPAYPVCMQIYGPVGYLDCRYGSIEQCRYLAVGRSAQCLVNPYFTPPRRPAPRRRPPRHAR